MESQKCIMMCNMFLNLISWILFKAGLYCVDMAVNAGDSVLQQLWFH